MILGILGSLVAPKIVNSLSARRVEAAARRIAADLEYARRSAEMSSSPRTVQFDISNESYLLDGIAALDRPAQAYSVALNKNPYRVDLVSADCGGDQSLVFTGYGTPDSGGTIVVSSGGVSRSVVIDPDSGRSEVQ